MNPQASIRPPMDKKSKSHLKSPVKSLVKSLAAPVRATALAMSLAAVLGSSTAIAGPSALPWNDDDGQGEMVTDENGNKIRMTKAEKAARAEELAPTLTAMLVDESFPNYTAATRRIDAEYVVYLGGFHLSTLSYSVAINGENYEVRANIRTEGLVDKIVRTNANIGSKGQIFEQRVQPELYNSDITDKNQRQLVSLTYDGIMPDEVLSFPHYNLNKYPVSALEKRKTVDPMSAILQMAVGASTPAEGVANPCGGTVPIFDGRRRFDLDLEFQKSEFMSSGDEGAYEGEALKCWVGYKKVAGYKPKKKKWNARRDGRSEWPDVYMWLAPIDEAKSLYMPIRFVAHTSFGAVVSRATKLKVTDIAPQGEVLRVDRDAPDGSEIFPN